MYRPFLEFRTLGAQKIEKSKNSKKKSQKKSKNRKNLRVLRQNTVEENRSHCATTKTLEKLRRIDGQVTKWRENSKFLSKNV